MKMYKEIYDLHFALANRYVCLLIEDVDYILEPATREHTVDSLVLVVDIVADIIKNMKKDSNND